MDGVRASKALKVQGSRLEHIGQLGWGSENWDKVIWDKGQIVGKIRA